MKLPHLTAIPPMPRAGLLNSVEVVEGGLRKVDQWDLVKGTGTALLRSGGLGPCIATAFHDPVTRTGYMHHEPCFALLEKTYLARIVGVIFQDYGNLSRLNVSAYGCSLYDDDEPQERQYSHQSRVLVEGILNFYFDRRQLNIEWTPPNAMGELFLDVQTGEFTKEFDLLSDFFE